MKIFSGVSTVLISVFYRVISFKHAHLTERVSLLTLIVTGEGIIGLSKSVSCIIKANKSTSANDIGAVITAVLLLYLIWMLYFDQLDEEGKMGTIRQQIWALLHFPLHCAIVLTVEGNTSLIPWNSAVQGLKLVWSLRPSPDDAPSTAFASNSAFVSYLNDSLWEISNHFKSYKLVDEYNWTVNLTSINDIAQNVTFNSDEYFSSTAPIIDEIFDYAANFVFKTHDATMYKMLEVTSSKSSTGGHDSLKSIYEIYDIITLYFYISAGATLLLLSAMYWFGKPHHTHSEAGGPLVRIIIGSLLIGSGCLAVFVDKSTSGYKFQQSTLLIPVVAVAYLVVIAFDTVFTFFSEHPETGAIIFHRGGRRGGGNPHRHKSTTSRMSEVDKSADTASIYSDQARMIPLDTMDTANTTASSTTTRHAHYDPAGDYSYHSNNASKIAELSTSSGAEIPHAQQSRMARFKSLKAPAYNSLQEDDDADYGSGDDCDDYDTGRLDRFDREK